MDKLIGFGVDAGSLVLFDPSRMTHRRDLEPGWVGRDELLLEDLKAERMLTLNMGGDGFYSVRVLDVAPGALIGRVVLSVGPFALTVDSGVLFVGDLSHAGSVTHRPGDPTWFQRLLGREPDPPATQFVEVPPGRYSVLVHRLYPPGPLRTGEAVGEMKVLTADEVPDGFADVVVVLGPPGATAEPQALPSLVLEAD